MGLCVTLQVLQGGRGSRGSGGICRYPESITSPRIFVEFSVARFFLIPLVGPFPFFCDHLFTFVVPYAVYSTRFCVQGLEARGGVAG